jgi:hypothetical protein
MPGRVIRIAPNPSRFTVRSPPSLPVRCRSHGATLATRNVSDFDGTGIEIMDPWLQSPG